MRKFYYSLLGTIISCMVSCSDKLNETEGENDMNPVTTTIHDENQSIMIYENIDDSFRGKTRSIKDTIYPNYYGGSYIDDEGGLVSLSTDNVDCVVEDLKLRAKSSNFKVEKCEYSLNELQSLNKKLGDFFENTSIANDLKWVSVGIDIINNKVSVDLEDCSEQMIAKFKSMVSDSPMIKFNEVSPIIWDSEYELRPFDSVKTSSITTSVQTNVHLGSSYSLTGKNQLRMQQQFVSMAL